MSESDFPLILVDVVNENGNITLHRKGRFTGAHYPDVIYTQEEAFRAIKIWSEDERIVPSHILEMIKKLV